MGLDMYLYARHPENPEGMREIGYWRKHHDLHGYMEKLYRKKGGNALDFNGILMQLTAQDLHDIAGVVKNRSLPPTTGFFFGNNPPNDESAKRDLLQIETALLEIKAGNEVFYDSSW